MGSFSFMHWLLVILVVVLLFGRGKVSELMGDVAKGIKSFKEGLADDPEESAKSGPAASHSKPSDPKSLEHGPTPTVDVKHTGDERKTG